MEENPKQRHQYTNLTMENPKQRHQCTNLTVESSNQCLHASIDEQFDKALK